MKTIDYIKSIGGITEASQVMPKEVFPILGIIGATIGVALVIVAIKRALKRPVRRPHRNRLKISPDLKKTKMPEWWMPKESRKYTDSSKALYFDGKGKLRNNSHKPYMFIKDDNGRDRLFEDLVTSTKDKKNGVYYEQLVLIDGLRKPDENPVPFHEKTMQHVAKF